MAIGDGPERLACCAAQSDPVASANDLLIRMTDRPRDARGRFLSLESVQAQLIELRSRVSAVEDRIPTDRHMIPGQPTVPVRASDRALWHALLIVIAIALFVYAASFAWNRWFPNGIDMPSFLTHRVPAPY